MDKDIINGHIYKITNKVDGKIYIGQTICGFKKRYGNNLQKNTTNIHLKNAINKYGIEPFEIIEIFDSSDSIDELNELEKYWIEFFGGINSGKIYNFTSGGLNAKLSDEFKEKLRIIKTGTKLSEETKKKMSIAQKEKNAKMTEEERKVYGAHKKGTKTSDDIKRKISETKKNAVNKKEIQEKIIAKKNKKVICLTNGKIFNSLKEAGEFYGFSSSMISTCCKVKREFAGRDENGIFLKWRYYEDFVKDCELNA